jgi:hypothetical protein
MRSSFAFLLLLCLALFSLNSCKKGCTNPKAGNYDPSAKVEDASCIFCDSTLLDNYLESDLFRDNNYQSTHYNDYVLQANVVGGLYTYVGNNCAKLGLGGGCQSGSFSNNYAYLSLIFSNTTNDTILVSGPFQLQVVGSEPISRTFHNLTIPPNGAVIDLANTYIPCIQIDFTQVSFSGYSLSFQYK